MTKWSGELYGSTSLFDYLKKQKHPNYVVYSHTENYEKCNKKILNIIKLAIAHSI